MMNIVSFSKKVDKEISKRITHFINTHCRSSQNSFHDAFNTLVMLHSTNPDAFDAVIASGKCPQ